MNVLRAEITRIQSTPASLPDKQRFVGPRYCCVPIESGCLRRRNAMLRADKIEIGVLLYA